MEKRSVSIAGHRTSISLEEEFWTLLQKLAAERGQSVASLIGEIDTDRIGREPPRNLSSAIRIHIIAWLQSQAGSGETGEP